MTPYILIVEDDPLMQRLLTRALTDRGYASRMVADGKQAKELIEKDPPQLLITDCFLPSMDGVHLCKFLRVDPRFKQLPMILMSGRLDPEILALCGEFGIDASFEKGTNSDEILATVDRLLKKKS